MPKIKIKNAEVSQILAAVEFPKYTTQIMNLANKNSGGTRPKIVGQMTDLIQEFGGNRYDDWVEWYKQKMPGAIDAATEKAYEMVQNLKVAMNQIDKDMVKKYIEDLVYTKTFVGLRCQECILKKVAEMKNTTYKLATPEEEAKGIDGYIGEKPVSIKPTTYKTKDFYAENIDCDFIFYEKKSDGYSCELNF